jgi:hypothetical protein
MLIGATGVGVELHVRHVSHSSDSSTLVNGGRFISFALMLYSAADNGPVTDLSGQRIRFPTDHTQDFVHLCDEHVCMLRVGCNKAATNFQARTAFYQAAKDAERKY